LATCSDLVVQKSLKEGFGLGVAEALWRGRAVVTGNTTVIRMQIASPMRPFLVDTVESAPKRS
jgi:trehalose synthase